MTTTEPYTGRLTTLEATISAEALIGAFHDGNGEFARLFFEADRDTLGALICYADLAIRGFARAADDDPRAVRQYLRQLVSQQQAALEQGEI